MNILCFKLEKVNEPFCMETVSDAVEHGLQKYDIDWNGNVNVNFNNQVKNNFIDIMNYVQYSKVDLDISDKEKEEGLKRFMNRKGDYLEVMSRDQDAFVMDHNVDLYAIVLLLNGVYQGHIYCWISPIDKNYCFTMGVRNRVDSSFIRQIPNISHYLLEGVRNFAIHTGAVHVMVIYPRPIMQLALPKLRFWPDRVLKNETIGKSIHPDYPMCKNCYRYQTIDTPIIEFLR